MAQAFAYFPVSLYIPSYSKAVGLSTLNGTIALAIFNTARVIGEPLIFLTCSEWGLADHAPLRPGCIWPRLRQDGVHKRHDILGHRFRPLCIPYVGFCS